MKKLNISLKVKNWGPITEGEIEIKPLTIFIGPNNTGKSYIAMLYYALVKSLNRIFEIYESPLILLKPVESSKLNMILEKLDSNLNIKKDEILSRKQVISSIVKARISNSSMKLSQIPLFIFKESLNEVINIIEEELAKVIRNYLIRELERVYSSKLIDLIKHGEKYAEIQLDIRSDLLELLLNTEIRKQEDIEIKVSIKILDEDRVVKNLLNDLNTQLHGWLLAKPRIKVSKYVNSLIRYTEVKLIGEISEKINANIIYLPASRAGILHSYRMVAKAIVQMAPLAPIRGAEIPPISGPIADFLASLIEAVPPTSITTMERAVSKKVVEEVCKHLEEDILEGGISVVREMGEPPKIIYKQDKHPIPIIRVSSMIAELSPLDIYLKYGLIGEGDVLIIEEPESHLHPDKQIKLAEILSSLINKMKLTVIITTHSDILLAKISNLTSLSFIAKSDKRSTRYLDIAINPEAISVYQFRKIGDNVKIETIKVTYEGIPDDMFRKIIENLYQETIDIYSKIQKIKQRIEYDKT